MRREGIGIPIPNPWESMDLVREIGGALDRYSGMGYPVAPERYGTVYETAPDWNGIGFPDR